MTPSKEKQIDYHTNFNLTDIVTLINVSVLIEKLQESNYPPDEIAFLEAGFTEGFDIGYEGPTNRTSTSNNIPFTVGDEIDLWNKLMKEVKLGRVAGPFKEIPFDNYIQSPIGLVPKAGGDQTRLIFHLSYDFKDEGQKSLNYHTPKNKCSIKYRDLDFAIKMYLNLCEELLASETGQEGESYRVPN